MKTSKSWRRRIEREKLYLKQGGFCYYCLRKLNMAGAKTHPAHGTLDHILPISRGGSNEWFNLVLACYRCNQAKGDRTEAEFRRSKLARAS